MRRVLALGLTTLAGLAGIGLLGPQALPASAAVAALAPQQAGLQLVAARNAFGEGSAASRKASALFALRSIEAMPINQPALALAAESGAVPDRLAALNLGAALGWRDELTNARLAELALATGEIGIAAQRIDALGRTRGGEAASTGADLLMAREGGPEALAARAANRTGGLWWIVYLRQPASDEAVLTGRIAFARSLEADDGPWRSDILAATAHGLALSQVDAQTRAELSSALKELAP